MSNLVNKIKRNGKIALGTLLLGSTMGCTALNQAEPFTPKQTDEPLTVRVDKTHNQDQYKQAIEQGYNLTKETYRDIGINIEEDGDADINIAFEPSDRGGIGLASCYGSNADVQVDTQKLLDKIPTIQDRLHLANRTTQHRK